MSNAIYWHQGLFLQPQHFQYFEQQQNQQQQQMWKSLTGYFWGSLSCLFDENQLSNNVVSLKKGEFVLKDGTWLSYFSSTAGHVVDNCSITDLVVDAEQFSEQKYVEIYLVLPSIQAHHTNMGESLRFAKEGVNKSISDNFHGGDPVDVPTVQYQARLSVQDDIKPDEQKLVIARLELTPEGLILDRNFVATCLKIQGSESLTLLCEAILKELLERCRQFEDYKGGQASGEFSNKIFRFRLALQTLSRYTAQLDHLMVSHSARPEDLYICLKQLVAELSIFSQKSDILGSQGSDNRALSYDHNQLNQVFSTVQLRIRDLLNELSVAPENLVRLEKQSSGLYQGNLRQQLLNDKMPLFVIVRSQTPGHIWQDDVLQFAKLGPSKLVPTLVERALPGLQLMLEQSRPEGLPHRPNSWYFRLMEEPEFMLALKNGDDLALDWGNAPDDVIIEVVQLKN
jgi:type VI secretion system protein ImpJ